MTQETAASRRLGTLRTRRRWRRTAIVSLILVVATENQQLALAGREWSEVTAREF